MLIWSNMFKNLKKRNRTYLRKGYSTNTKQDDSKSYRCKVCGHPCHETTTEILTGDRIASSFVEGTTYLVDSDGDTYPDVKKGCPLCGTLYSR